MKWGKPVVAAGILMAFCTSLWGTAPETVYAKDKKKQESKADRKGSWQPELRVGIYRGLSHVNFRVNIPCVLQETKSEKRIVFFSPGKVMKISHAGGRLVVDGKKTDAVSLTLRPQQKKPISDMKVTINGDVYPGGAQILLRGGSITVNNLVAAEDYLRGVLPEEMPVDWPEEALKAQAVAARTFALQHRKRHEDEGYDLCDTTHCQVYGGVESADPRANRAIDATYGEVLTYRGKLINAFFHTDSGGMTERCLDVWGTDVPYLQAAKEAETGTQPWSVSFSRKEFSGKLAAAGKNVGTVKSVKLSKLRVGKGSSDRSASGRVKSVEIKGDKGSRKFTGNEIRSAFGLRSTLFDIKLSGDRVTISGFGWGHGLGMSQWGAKAYAEKLSYDKILSHYYKNTKLKKLY